jgi:hypothetical protein
MPNLIVAYDLHEEDGADYEKVEKAVEKLGSAVHIELSVWYVRSKLTPKEARDKLKSVMRDGDKLFVGKLSGCAWFNLNSDHASFIRDDG